MNSKRRKRLRFHNQDKDNFCMPNLLNSHSGYGKQNGKATAEVIDFSDAFALRNLLENLDGGKYGSVTKEYERIHAQRMQVINFFSALRSSLVNGCSNPESKSFQGGLNTNSDPSTCPNQVESARHSNGYVAQNVIDLDVDSVATVAEPTNDHVQDLCREPYEGAPQQSVPSMPHLPSSHLSLMGNKTSDVTGVTSDLPEKKDGNNNRSVIILESDEEGDDHLGKNWSSKSEYEAGTFEKCLESQLQLCLRQAKISSQDSHFNQLVPYDQQYAKADRYVAGEVDWQPSIQYEKVVLKNVPEQRPSHGHVVLSNVSEQRPTHNNVVSRNVSEQRPTHGHVGEKDMQNKKNESRRHKRKEGESLYSGANLDKEAAKSPSPISPMASHGHSLSIESHNKYDPETPKSDGFESHNKYAPETPKSDGFESHNKYAPETPKSDGLEDLWKDMSLAMECSKNVTSDGSAVVQKEDDCNHSFVLEDDLGLVCRVCGVIQKSIETIFDNQWIKGTRSTRTYIPSSRSPNDLDEKIEYSGPKFSEDDLTAAEISVHPRHMKQMKPHQLEGFSFLVRNLVTDKPQGCILAHAPGSGKTFMLISFIQSFFAKYPHARPLVVLPKGILPTWKREFQRWQVEDIPLYDFYSSKADSRFQQLDVLKSWEESKSILFLGYKQFTTIVCCGTTCKVTSACQERLLKVPSLLILDEGHTPRNVDTDVLNSLAKVQTPRKVVLSGTLFQNHVREVFTILDLVRPNFLKMESSRVLVKRVLSRVHIPGRSRMPIKGSTSTRFYDLVEETLQNDDNYKRKITVIQDLRELTQNVLHYYKGDFLEELPGLVDFTVLLNLTDKQKEIVQRKLKRSFVGKFKKNSVGNAVYIHPYLKDIADNAASDRGSVLNDDKIDNMLDSLDVRDGVKTKFFLNILSMTEAAGEKLLAFSQYLLPMKFLERVIIRVKGWRVGKEIFMITGDSSTEDRERSMDQFNNSPDAKVLFGSIKACGEGISLVGASRVVILDVHLNPSVTRQAIGRVFRPGQEKKVYTYRLVAADSPEEEDHTTSFRKELTSKMWFEWCEYSGLRDFELEEIGISDCEDTFLESPILAEDVKILYRR